MQVDNTADDDRLELSRSHPDIEHEKATVSLEPELGYVGEELTIECSAAPPNQRIEIHWHTFEGEWEMLNHHQVVGPAFSETVEFFDSFTTDEDGRGSTTRTVPEAYGGKHTIELVANGETLAATTFSIRPHFELAQSTANLGETFELQCYGLEPDPVRSVYQVTWDNSMVGYVTGVGNNGSATASIRAVGPVGKHTMTVWRGYRGVPFLQTETQPFATPGGDGAASVTGDDRQRSWTVEVVPPEERPEATWMDPLSPEEPVAEHADVDEETTDAELVVDPVYGQAGTTATIAGRNFPPHETVSLIWHRHEGHFAQGIPITAEPKPDVLPAVETDSDGSFSVDFEVPHDKGATSPIAAAVGGTTIAKTAFMLQPSIVEMSPKSGPVGTEIDCKISGIGWPIPEMSPYITYDNVLVGYICSEDDHREHGLTHFKLPASGEPGLHFIDVHPSVFETQDDIPNIEISPHLSADDAHPGRSMPGIHFAFEVTD